MNTLKEKRFKGEIERYLNQNHNLFESRVKEIFSLLNIKTCLHRSGIFKKDGYHTAHLLFVLVVLPMLKLKTVHSFCNKFWLHWSKCQKDTFYRFKRNTSYRWRTFLWKINLQIFKKLDVDKIPINERYFVLDDTILPKRGRKLENISFVWDHSSKKSVLGYCSVVLALFTDKGIYPLDFAYRFGKTRHGQSQAEVIGSPKNSFGQRCYEAKYKTKLELGKSMIQRALKNGITAGYVLFDSWYSHPSFIKSILDLDEQIQVVCRLKNSKTKYWYKSKPYTLNELYKKVQSGLKKDTKTGLSVKRVSVTHPQFDSPVVIVFARGYKEPKIDDVKGKKTSKQAKWSAFLSTDESLHCSSIIQKYIKRWPIEVCFKECKQLLELGKDQANDFQSQVTGTTISFLRYNLLNYLNVLENHQTLGGFFELLVDEMAVTSYARRLFEYFMGLFKTGILKIFDLFSLEDDFNSYVDIIGNQLCTIEAFRGCET